MTSIKEVEKSVATQNSVLRDYNSNAETFLEEYKMKWSTSERQCRESTSEYQLQERMLQNARNKNTNELQSDVETHAQDVENLREAFLQ